jgi:cold-inducible RNA-binding protein
MSIDDSVNVTPTTMSYRIFVGGLSGKIKEGRLRAAFEPFGDIVEVRVVTDRYTGRSKGFGFVSFKKSEDATSAIAKMNGADLDGRRLRCDIDKSSSSWAGVKPRYGVEQGIMIDNAGIRKF